MSTERIRELAEQAVSRFDKDMDGSMEPTENGRWVYYDDLTEFAELIVKECLGDFKDRIAKRYQGSDRDRDVAYGMEVVYSNIRDKFGVNE